MSNKFSTDWELPVDELRRRLRRSSMERVSWMASAGRVLSQSIVADRDSPAAAVSAMDGYALAIGDLQRTDAISFSGQSVPGHPPPQRTAMQAMRVFTGGIVPASFDLVVKREDTIEHEHSIMLHESARQGRVGENIRRQGENARQGQPILSPGQLMTGPALAAAANFGAAEVEVARQLRVAILTTGDELCSVDQVVEAWQLRDSNGPTLYGMLQRHRWIDLLPLNRVQDRPESLHSALQELLDQVDVVILTGGVSMGDFDFVPKAIKDVGGEIVFHKLPIRPGKPILGAVGPAGQLLLGLPGNPVSAAICAARFGLPLLASMAGLHMTNWHRTVSLTNPDDKSISLNWFRLVRLVAAEQAELVSTHGSGDLVSLASSSGFVFLPAGASGVGPWTYFAWN